MSLVPPANPLTAPYWEAARRHEFVLQFCPHCERYVFYPRPNCPYCAGSRLEWRPASGEGSVHTFTVARRPTHPAFAGREPLVIALVELAEGPRLTTNLVDVEPDAVRIGMAVHVTFHDVSETVTLPVFAPATTRD
jgi:uncharacterized OB-fold protein